MKIKMPGIEKLGLVAIMLNSFLTNFCAKLLFNFVHGGV